MKTTKSTVLKFGLVLAVTSVLVVGWLHRWQLYDYWHLRNYTPSAEVAKLATDVSLNDKARRTFYVYDPQLNDKAAFNKNCKSSEQTIVLGCYVSRTGIYLYAVDDKRLDGVVQVTAAHEMLHAAYERLNIRDKRSVDAMVNEAYGQITDERIRSTIDDYRKNGADVTNELHSILGTEVRNLPPKLEEYYKRYFNDRTIVVGYSEKYEQAFTDRKNKVAAYDKQLDELRKDIDSGQATLGAQSAGLESERVRLEALLAAKSYAAYNEGVNGYNGQVNTYNTQVKRVRGLIDQFNKVVADRNAIATEEGELVKAIDSRPSTIDTQ